MMKTFLFALAAAGLMVTMNACSTGAAVNTPIVDVGTGVAVGR